MFPGFREEELRGTGFGGDVFRVVDWETGARLEFSFGIRAHVVRVCYKQPSSSAREDLRNWDS